MNSQCQVTENSLLFIIYCRTYFTLIQTITTLLKQFYTFMIFLFWFVCTIRQFISMDHKCVFPDCLKWTLMCHIFSALRYFILFFLTFFQFSEPNCWKFTQMQEFFQLWRRKKVCISLSISVFLTKILRVIVLLCAVAIGIIFCMFKLWQ